MQPIECVGQFQLNQGVSRQNDEFGVRAMQERWVRVCRLKYGHSKKSSKWHSIAYLKFVELTSPHLADVTGGGIS